MTPQKTGKKGVLLLFGGFLFVWAWIFWAISSRERETVYFSLRTLWWIFVIFYQDTVVDFCLNTEDSQVLGRG